MSASVYERHTDYLKFPSGRSVQQLRKDAKTLRIETGQKLSLCLDQVALINGGTGSWAHSIETVLEQSIASYPPQSTLMTMDDLLGVAKRHSKITQYGVGMWADIAEIRPWKTFEEHLKDETDSVYMLHSNCNLALAYIDQLRPQKKINTDSTLTSNELKHHVEHAFDQMGVQLHIHHGAFILAALHRGFLPQRCSPSSLSVFFNISPDSPILRWNGGVDSPIAKAMKEHIRTADPARFADV
jgi:hypothetical protein